MSGRTNRYHYDVKNCYRFKGVRSDDGTVSYENSDPVAEPGLMSFEASPNGDLKVIRADGIDYIVITNNGGYDITLNFVKISDAFRIDQLGEVQDPATGIIYEDADAEPAPFALTGEFKGDAEGIRWIYYNCTANRFKEGGDNKENQKEPDTESVDVKASPLTVEIDGKEVNIVRGGIIKSNNAETYDAWFESVQLPTGPAETEETNGQGGT